MRKWCATEFRQKTQSAIDPLTQAPSYVADKQLKELHIKVETKKDKEKDLFEDD